MKKMRFYPKSSLVLAVSAGLLAATSAWAEAPMNADDAGTLDKGGMKVEGVWSKDDRTTGGELLFGLSPVDNLELEVAVARGRNDEFKANGTGFGIKWVPYQNDTGWSLGARFDHGRTRVTDHATPARHAKHDYELTGLASYRLKNGQALHLNLGAARHKAQDGGQTSGTWGVGYEFPLAANLQLTMEAFGEESSRPDKSLGLRYEIRNGLKLSVATGRGNDRSFGQVGFAWEF